MTAPDARHGVMLASLAIAGSLGGSRPAAEQTELPVFSPIVELRQYTLHPGKRDELIALFDGAFIEPQEAAGATIIGEFRNLDDPNKFVWLRGFPDMPSRAAALTAFYDGAVWKSKRDSANLTIIDNDNVLLLRPAHAGTGFTLDTRDRPPRSTTGAGHGVIVATIYHIDPTDAKETEFIAFFDHRVMPLLVQAGAPVLATFVPERSANNFPRLPVREGAHVFVWFTRFANESAYARFTSTLAAIPAWRDSVAVELSSKIREPQTLRLSPTARSLLHD